MAANQFLELQIRFLARKVEGRLTFMVEPPRKDGTFTRDDIAVEQRMGGLLRHHWKKAA